MYVTREEAEAAKAAEYRRMTLSHIREEVHALGIQAYNLSLDKLSRKAAALMRSGTTGSINRALDLVYGDVLHKQEDPSTENPLPESCCGNKGSNACCVNADGSRKVPSVVTSSVRKTIDPGVRAACRTHKWGKARTLKDGHGRIYGTRQTCNSCLAVYTARQIRTSTGARLLHKSFDAKGMVRFKAKGQLRIKQAGDQRVIYLTASSDSIDLEADRMMLSALQCMRDQAPGLICFLDHTYSIRDGAIFGTVTDARIDFRDGFNMLDLEVKVAESNPHAISAYNLIEEGVAIGVSIGCLVNGTEKTNELFRGRSVTNITDVQLLEVSLVGVPANAHGIVWEPVAA